MTFTRRRVRRRHTDRPSRRGAMIVLVAAMIAILLTMTVFSVDVAYMQLVRTQLRAASDAAAKAGVEALNRTGDSNQAIAAAIAAAGRNKVAGKSLVITSSDITLGRGVAGANGEWQFQQGGSPPTAVRVDVAMNDGSSAGSVDLMFASAIGSGKFTPAESSTAANLDQEIVLCIDRSHSMCFDESGVQWRYPSGWGGWRWIPWRGWRYTDPVTLPPHPSQSRWASLESAVNLFVTTAQSRSLPPRVAVVTWGSTIGTNTYEYQLTGQTEVAVQTDLALSTNLSSVSSAIASRKNNVMLGGTNMGVGLQRAIDILTAGNVRPLANKTIVLMTDGQWNQGTDPRTLALTARAAGITIHTVTFIPGSDQAVMAQVATNAGGQHYHADNRGELEDAFEELALTLPIVLTD